MKCERCGDREAIMEVRHVEEGKSRQIQLCEACAADQGITASGVGPETPLGGFLATMWQGANLEEAELVPGGACPGCGGSYADFRQTGRFGCAECWRLFEPAIRVLLRRYHGSTRHLGRAPVPRTDGVLKAEQAGALRERLRQAVETEDFELAARIRDQLEELH